MTFARCFEVAIAYPSGKRNWQQGANRKSHYYTEKASDDKRSIILHSCEG